MRSSVLTCLGLYINLRDILISGLLSLYHVTCLMHENMYGSPVGQYKGKG